MDDTMIYIHGDDMVDTVQNKHNKNDGVEELSEAGAVGDAQRGKEARRGHRAPQVSRDDQQLEDQEQLHVASHPLQSLPKQLVPGQVVCDFGTVPAATKHW